MGALELGGYSVFTVLLAVSLLLIVSVLASRISAVAGIPSLLVFLAIGMLAGSEGPGGIEYSNYPLSLAIGSVSLAFIIFDGGMRTPWRSVRPVLAIGISLASVGVLVTAFATGLFARFALGLGWIESFLLGAIVSSTDAAAVFAVLRARNLSLRGRVRRVLEFEAGSNDPMAVLLTVGVLAYAQAPEAGAMALARLFLLQAALGFLGGWLGGKAMVWMINNASIEHEGLYSVLLFGFVLLLFGATSSAGGSGFLAVYVGGLLVGNADLLHKSSLLKFHDGIAWIAQILLFLTLGLLVFPSHLPPMWLEGLLLALFLTFVARPLCVLVAAPSPRLHWKDRLFISWVGLRGAAPIILATLPWSAGLPNAQYYFNLVFFVVLISVLLQGTSITLLAKVLRLVEPLPAEPPEGVGGLLPAGFIAVELHVLEDAPAYSRRLFQLGLPSGVVLTSIERDGRYLVPSGDTLFRKGDRVRALARPSNLAPLRRTFGEARVSKPSEAVL
jgi:potassium/hydrogen antiporter